MKRAIFSAVGLFLILLGLQCILVSRFVFHWTEEVAATAPADDSSRYWGSSVPLATNPVTVRKSELKSKDWHPWSFIMPGVILMLYGATLPKV